MDHRKNQRGSKKHIDTNQNKNMKTQNLWDAAEAILRGKFIAIKSYLKKQTNKKS